MSPLAHNSFILPRIAKIVGICVLVIFLTAYVAYQARYMLKGPSIVLTGAYSPVQHERVVTLTGQTQNIVKLTLNGKEIHTDIDGAFTRAVVLEDGYSIILLSAQDRFGRKTAVTRGYFYSPTTSPSMETSTSSENGI